MPENETLKRLLVRLGVDRTDFDKAVKDIRATLETLRTGEKTAQTQKQASLKATQDAEKKLLDTAKLVTKAHEDQVKQIQKEKVSFESLGKTSNIQLDLQKARLQLMQQEVEQSAILITNLEKELTIERTRIALEEARFRAQMTGVRGNVSQQGTGAVISSVRSVGKLSQVTTPGMAGQVSKTVAEQRQELEIERQVVTALESELRIQQNLYEAKKMILASLRSEITREQEKLTILERQLLIQKELQRRGMATAPTTPISVPTAGVTRRPTQREAGVTPVVMTSAQPRETIPEMMTDIRYLRQAETTLGPPPPEMQAKLEPTTTATRTQTTATETSEVGVLRQQYEQEQARNTVAKQILQTKTQELTVAREDISAGTQSVAAQRANVAVLETRQRLQMQILDTQKMLSVSGMFKTDKQLADSEKTAQAELKKLSTLEGQLQKLSQQEGVSQEFIAAGEREIAQEKMLLELETQRLGVMKERKAGVPATMPQTTVAQATAASGVTATTVVATESEIATERQKLVVLEQEQSQRLQGLSAIKQEQTEARAVGEQSRRNLGTLTEQLKISQAQAAINEVPVMQQKIQAAMQIERMSRSQIADRIKGLEVEQQDLVAQRARLKVMADENVFSKEAVVLYQKQLQSQLNINAAQQQQLRSQMAHTGESLFTRLGTTMNTVMQRGIGTLLGVGGGSGGEAGGGPFSGMGQIAGGMVVGGITLGAINELIGMVGKLKNALIDASGTGQTFMKEFERLAAMKGIDPTVMLDKLRVATRGLVEDTDLFKIANGFLRQSMNVTSDQVVRLVGNTMDLGRAMGKTSTEISRALEFAFLNPQRGMMILARATGISIDQLSRSIRGLPRDMDPAQKATIMFNVILAETEKRLLRIGRPATTLPELFKQISVVQKNFIGDVATAALGAGNLGEAIQKASKMIADSMPRLREIAAVIGKDLAKAVRFVIDHFSELKRGLEILLAIQVTRWVAGLTTGLLQAATGYETWGLAINGVIAKLVALMATERAEAANRAATSLIGAPGGGVGWTAARTAAVEEGVLATEAPRMIAGAGGFSTPIAVAEATTATTGVIGAGTASAVGAGASTPVAVIVAGVLAALGVSWIIGYLKNHPEKTSGAGEGVRRTLDIDPNARMVENAAKLLAKGALEISKAAAEFGRFVPNLVSGIQTVLADFTGGYFYGKQEPATVKTAPSLNLPPGMVGPLTEMQQLALRHTPGYKPAGQVGSQEVGEGSLQIQRQLAQLEMQIQDQKLKAKYDRLKEEIDSENELYKQQYELGRISLEDYLQIKQKQQQKAHDLTVQQILDEEKAELDKFKKEQGLEIARINAQEQPLRAKIKTGVTGEEYTSIQTQLDALESQKAAFASAESGKVFEAKRVLVHEQANAKIAAADRQLNREEIADQEQGLQDQIAARKVYQSELVKLTKDGIQEEQKNLEERFKEGQVSADDYLSQKAALIQQEYQLTKLELEQELNDSKKSAQEKAAITVKLYELEQDEIKQLMSLSRTEDETRLKGMESAYSRIKAMYTAQQEVAQAGVTAFQPGSTQAMVSGMERMKDINEEYLRLLTEQFQAQQDNLEAQAKIATEIGKVTKEQVQLNTEIAKAKDLGIPLAGLFGTIASELGGVLPKQWTGFFQQLSKSLQTMSKVKDELAQTGGFGGLLRGVTGGRGSAGQAAQTMVDEFKTGLKDAKGGVLDFGDYLRKSGEHTGSLINALGGTVDGLKQRMDRLRDSLPELLQGQRQKEAMSYAGGEVPTTTSELPWVLPTPGQTTGTIPTPVFGSPQVGTPPLGTWTPQTTQQTAAMLGTPVGTKIAELRSKESESITDLVKNINLLDDVVKMLTEILNVFKMNLKSVSDSLQGLGQTLGMGTRGTPTPTAIPLATSATGGLSSESPTIDQIMSVLKSSGPAAGFGTAAGIAGGSDLLPQLAGDVSAIRKNSDKSASGGANNVFTGVINKFKNFADMMKDSEASFSDKFQSGMSAMQSGISIAGSMIGAIQQIAQAQTTGQGAAQGAMTGFSFGMQTGNPIIAAIGAGVGAAIGGIFGHKHEETNNQVDKIMGALGAIKDAVNNGTLGLGKALQDTLKIRAQAQAAAQTASHKSGWWQSILIGSPDPVGMMIGRQTGIGSDYKAQAAAWKKLKPEIDKQITELEAQIQKVMQQLHDSLEIITQPTAFQPFLTSLQSIMTQYKQFADAAVGNAQEVANANLWLSKSLQGYLDTLGTQMNDAQQQAIQNAIQLIDLQQQELQLDQQHAQNVYDVLTRGVLTQQRPTAMTKGAEIEGLDTQYNLQKQNMDEQRQLAQYRYDMEQKIFGLSSNRVDLEKQLLNVQEQQVNTQIKSIMAMMQVMATVQQMVSQGTTLNTSGAMSMMDQLLQLLGLPTTGTQPGQRAATISDVPQQWQVYIQELQAGPMPNILNLLQQAETDTAIRDYLAVEFASSNIVDWMHLAGAALGDNWRGFLAWVQAGAQGLPPPPSYDVGSTFVPATTLATVHQGESIFPQGVFQKFTDSIYSLVPVIGGLLKQVTTGTFGTQMNPITRSRTVVGTPVQNVIQESMGQIAQKTLQEVSQLSAHKEMFDLATMRIGMEHDLLSAQRQQSQMEMTRMSQMSDLLTEMSRIGNYGQVSMEGGLAKVYELRGRYGSAGFRRETL